MKNMTEKILSTLLDGALETIDILRAINQAGYGASRRQMERKLEEIKNRRINPPTIQNYNKQNFYNLISKLKREGLVTKKGGGWIITANGKKRLAKIKKGLPKADYIKIVSPTFKIFMFDIPEKYQTKRQWLRNRLRELDFKMVQKSVWMGKTQLPEEFISDLRQINIIDYVHILEITKSGSLREIE